jgi:hypothetical protein
MGAHQSVGRRPCGGGSGVKTAAEALRAVAAFDARIAQDQAFDAEARQAREAYSQRRMADPPS